LQRLVGSKADYLQFYGLAKDLWLPVSRETGTLLYMLARTMKAQGVVEFGTSFGISTIHLAAALRDNVGGKLITTEFEPSEIVRARQHIEEAGPADLVEIREGDALSTLASNLPETIDLVLFDGAKPLYPDILVPLKRRLRPGAMIVADNADHSPDYLVRMRSPSTRYLSLPFDGDVELPVKLG